jgi:tetratricopeptide (TPR) repeat protein
MNNLPESAERRIASGLIEDKRKYDSARFTGSYEQAESLFREALTLDPDNFRALLGLGRCHSHYPSRYEEAVLCFEKAAAVSPDDPEPSYLAGLAYLRAEEAGVSSAGLNLPDSAVLFFRKALDAGYNDVASLYNLIGTAHFRRRDYEQALQGFRESAALIAQNGGWIPSTFFLGAESARYLGRLDEALEWYEAARRRGLSVEDDYIDQQISEILTLRQDEKGEPA